MCVAPMCQMGFTHRPGQYHHSTFCAFSDYVISSRLEMLALVVGLSS